MKLNNHGWGLKEMLLIIGLLTFALVVAIFYINSLYDGLANSNVSEQIMDATNQYIYQEFDSYTAPYDLMITLEKLKEKTDLSISKDCKGYVMVKIENGEQTIKNKIVCD